MWAFGAYIRRPEPAARGRSKSGLMLSIGSTGSVWATRRSGPYFSSLINSRDSNGESTRPMEWFGTNSARWGSMG
jgi:hypothetical protein